MAERFKQAERELIQNLITLIMQALQIVRRIIANATGKQPELHANRREERERVYHWEAKPTTCSKQATPNPDEQPRLAGSPDDEPSSTMPTPVNRQMRNPPTRQSTSDLKLQSQSPSKHSETQLPTDQSENQLSTNEHEKQLPIERQMQLLITELNLLTCLVTQLEPLAQSTIISESSAQTIPETELSIPSMATSHQWPLQTTAISESNPKPTIQTPAIEARNHKEHLMVPCSQCGNLNHAMLQCPQTSLDERRMIVWTYSLCYLCLRKGHKRKYCNSMLKCHHCEGGHHTLLCPGNVPAEDETNCLSDTWSRKSTESEQVQPTTQLEMPVQMSTGHTWSSQTIARPELSPPVKPESSIQSQVERRPSARTTPMMTTPTAGSSTSRADLLTPPCGKCGHNYHTELRCHKTTAEERRETAWWYDVCTLCLEGGHTAEQCTKNYDCYACVCKHHFLFCDRSDYGKSTSRQGYGRAKTDQVEDRPTDLRGGGDDNEMLHYWSSTINHEEDSCDEEFFASWNADEQQLSSYNEDSDDDESKCCMMAVTMEEEALTSSNVVGHEQSLNAEQFAKRDGFVILDVSIDGRQVSALLDTGANVNMFPTRLAREMGLTTFPVMKTLRTPQGMFTVTEALRTFITIGFITRMVEFLLYEVRQTILLGVEVMRNFRLTIDFNLNVQQNVKDQQRGLRVKKHQVYHAIIEPEVADDEKPELLERLIRSFKQIFAEGGASVGLIKTEKCKINLTDNMPVAQRPYRCPANDQSIIDRKIKELLEQKMIRLSTSPYAFPVVLVSKKDEGEKSRFCINYIKLNLITVSELFPMPRIEEMKDHFLGANWFTTVDIASGFYHIEVEEADKPKTAFSTVSGHFEWNRMPFGLKNAPVIFQRVIANLLQKHSLSTFALNYIDDIVVFSRTYDEHLEHLSRLFAMLKAEDIRLKLSKCQFAKKSVVYLGFQIERDSFKPLNSNTAAIENVPPPENQKALRSFIGKAGFYNRFIPNRAKLLYPLYQLLKKTVEWIWDDDAQKAFEQVKQILTSAPVLHIFNPADLTFIYTDASRKGIGAVMKQAKPTNPKEQYPIGFFSKTLFPHQKNYSVTEIELLAIVSAIDFWHYYLMGHFFVVITDHAPLKAIQKFSKIGTRLMNWSMQLRQYNFRVEYTPGNTNQEADFLSRHPVEILYEATEAQVYWVDENRIKEAHQKCDPCEIPKRVRNEGDQNEKRLVYVRGERKKIFLPFTLAEQVLQELHDDKGHIGRKQLEEYFTRKYFTVQLADLMRKLIMKCDICNRVKKTGRRLGTLGVIGPAMKPFDIVHIDTKSGFKHLGSVKEHLHLAIDGFTRFAWAVESKTRKPVDFMNLLSKIIAVQKPKLIVADNYSSIKGRLFREYLEARGIEIQFVAVNHQSANGLIERLNQTIIDRLRCKKLENPKWAWTTLARKCVEQYNRTIHTTTRYPPIYLLTGEDEEGLFQDETLELSRKKALERSRKRHDESARAYDFGRKDPVLEPGEQVFVHAKHALNRKILDPTFEGPYEVKRRIGQTMYEVEKNGKIERRHISQMKLTRIPPFERRKRHFSC